MCPRSLTSLPSTVITRACVLVCKLEIADCLLPSSNLVPILEVGGCSSNLMQESVLYFAPAECSLRRDRVRQARTQLALQEGRTQP